MEEVIITYFEFANDRTKGWAANASEEDFAGREPLGTTAQVSSYSVESEDGPVSADSCTESDLAAVGVDGVVVVFSVAGEGLIGGVSSAGIAVQIAGAETADAAVQVD